ncbi:MAG: PKD domain-containing protein [Thermoanaerobaculia bacterium]
MNSDLSGAAMSFARKRSARVVLPRVAWVIVAVAVCGQGASHAEAPPLPSSRFGSVTVAGAPAAPGTIVTAYLAGSQIANGPVFDDGGGHYRLDVPGDRPETPEIEGPVAGQSFEIRVAGTSAGNSTWSAGAFTALDLAAAAGPDLAIAIDDGQATALPSQILNFSLSAQNPGATPASGVQIAVTLPPGATFLSASDGGLYASGEVRWPALSLAPATFVARSLAFRLPARFAAGIENVATTARIAHDGSRGGDPQPANDQATDLDLLLAAPDLVAAIDDGSPTTTPGGTVSQRLRIANTGSQDATNVTLAIDLPAEAVFYSASHGGILSAGTVSFPAVNLAAGASLSRAVTLRIPTGLPPTVTELAVVGRAADDGANGPDATPADNTAIDLDSVTHAPDLAVESVDATAAPVDPQTLAISGEIAVEFTNRGTIAADAFQIVVFEDLDGNRTFSRTTDRLVGEVAVGGATVGERSTVTLAVAGLLELRDDRIFAVLDADAAIPELDESNNVGDSGTACGTLGDLTQMSPEVELAWPPAGGPAYKPLSVDSVSTPIVVQLTDDNGDGRWDANDVPDIVFVSANLAPTFPPEPDIVLRAIRGDTGAAVWNVPGLFTVPPSFLSLCGLAAGDIDGDGKVEIVTSVVTPEGSGFLQAYEHNGAFKWRSNTYDTHPFASGTSNRDNPSIADLDGDGNVEIVVGAYVFDRAGHRLWAGTGGQAYQTQRNNQLVGGAISVVADVDLDGLQEIVTGNTLYRFDGSIIWQRPDPDGYPAVLNADDDPQAEIVVVAQGFIRLYDTDGTLIWGPLEMPGSDPESGGPPSVGDLDGDGVPEIVVAGSDILWALHLDGTPLWQASTRDYSSSQTGATLFDFEGDGTYEVVYRDERRLRIYRGSDGEVLFEHVLSSTTMVEMPVVADVDRDGNAEIVVTSDHAWDYPVPSGERTAGLLVFGDFSDNWVGARPIWNQHAYSIDNVTVDAGIPAHPAWGWLDHNSFRANAGPTLAERGGTDVTAGRLVIDSSALPLIRATVRIGNAGTTPIPAGLEVWLHEGDESWVNLRAVAATSTPLPPGAHLDLELSFDAGAGVTSPLIAIADALGRERECDEQNNRVEAAVDVTALGMWVTVTDGTSGASPGDHLTYVVTAHNAFAGTATGIAVADTLPAGLQFVAASGGGVESGGTVTWPVFSLASGAATARTVTVLVDPALPLAVSSLSNVAMVADDGANGPDPTPANNQATDIDQVVSVVADAGGPYSGDEGAEIQFDASASIDRDGGALLFAWDLDGDGAFDDGNAATASHIFADEGTFTIRLRVTDDEGEVDLDEATVTVANVAPQIVAPVEIAGTEGGHIDLSGFRVLDPGVLDYGPSTVDWGDGIVDSLWVDAGIPQGEHLYPQDGIFTVEVCADDGDGGRTCASAPARIANEPPIVQRGGDLGFAGWQREELGGGATSRWTTSADERAVTQELNGEPAFFVGDLPGYGTTELTLRVNANGDDDYVGFAVGFEAGDTTRGTAEYLLVDWKQGDQSGARRGLALSRVVGAPSAGEFWVHQDLAANGTANRVVELQRAAHLGTAGWARQTEYRLRIEASPTRLRLYVDGRLEIDYIGPVPNGVLALYDYSQAGAQFGGGVADSYLAGREGDLVRLRAAFSDAGILDTHTATIDWGDGDSAPGAISEEEGQGFVLGQHTYRDDGDGTVGVCVSDDGGDEHCVEIPVAIDNAAPVLALAVGSAGFVEEAVTLAGSTFTDAGIDDTHEVSVDWGDGASESLPVAGAAGSWSFDGAHFYATPGAYEVAVCVVDDDGGESCDTRSLNLVHRALDLRLAMSLLPVEARPGQNVVFTLRVENAGTLMATGVVLDDAVPTGLTYVSSTLGGVSGSSAVTWNLGSLAPGAVVSPTVTMQVPATAPIGGTATNTAVVGDDGTAGPDATPGDNSAMAAVLFSDALTPIVAISGASAGWTGAEGTLLVLSGVTWNDTTAGQTHTGTIAWGDGQTTAATLTPANGIAGTVGGNHVYAQDGVYPVEICVRDATARVGCRSALATVANLAPGVIEPGAVDLHSWIEEEYETADVSALWTVAADGLSVYQSINSQPSVFFSPLPAVGSFLEGTIRVEPAGNWDNDYIGFVLGFQAGDTLNPDSDFLVVDWKQGNQSPARGGLAVSRVLGAIGEEFWAHTDSPNNGAGTGVFELARAVTLGSTGWADNREYRFRFEIAPDRLRIWVDGVQQFDLAIAVPTGKFGFYNYSQEAVRYRGFSTGLQQRFEGETFDLSAPFTDAGVLDLHTATVAWDDGASSEADAATEEGFGIVTASHTYADDGDFSIQACVEDDAGARDCGSFPLLVLNLPPAITPAADASGVADSSARFALATFTDPGTLDSHQATVDWGDGTVEEAEVEEDGGAGTVAATHAYDLSGSYPVAVCVTDDDGATACTDLVLTIGGSPPQLRAEKSATVFDRDGDGRATPGDDIVYRIEVFNDALEPATSVRVIDPVPAHTTLVPGSIFPELGVVSIDPVTVDLDPIDGTSSVVVQFAVTIASPLPAGVTAIVNSGIVQSAEAPPAPTDDPALPGMSDPTRTPVFVSPDLTATKRATPIDLDGDGVASPGDQITWTIEVHAAGDSPAGGVLVRDAIGPHLALVPGSLAAPGAHVLSISPLALVYDEIAVGGAVEITFRTTIDPALPAEVEAVANQATVLATDVDAFLSDDPDTPVAADPTVVPVYVDPTLTVSGLSLAEGNAGLTPVVFPVTLDRPARLATTVDWTVEGITGTAGEDFVAASGTLTIPVGSSTGEIVIQAIGDLLVENDELLRLVLSAPAHAELAVTEVFATLINDDFATLAISDATVEEGAVAIFTVQLSAPSSLPVSVEYATADGAAVAGADFTASSGTLVFAPFETVRSVTVATLEDSVAEPTETFSVLLSNVSGAGLADASGSGTIIDNDSVNLSIADAEVVEGDSGDVELALPIQLSAPSFSAVEVDVSVTAGSATEGSDYSAVGGHLTIPVGETAAWVVIVVHGDLLDEADETIQASLTNVVGATLGSATATGTILDDDDEATPGCLGPNLLQNGGAEERPDGCEVPGWTEVAGDWWVRRAEPSFLPAEGERYFVGRSGESDDDGHGHGDLWQATGGSGGSGGSCEGDDNDDDDHGQGHPQLDSMSGDHGDDGEGCHGGDDLAAMNGGGHGDDDEDCVAELAQTVDVSAFAARISAGAQAFVFSGAVRTELDDGSARVRVIVEYLPASGSTVLETFDTGWIWSDGLWLAVENERTAPTGTRKIRVHLYVEGDDDHDHGDLGEAHGGGDDDDDDGEGGGSLGLFDALELRPVDTTVLWARDLFEYEGQSGLHDAWVPLDVFCPADFPIGLTYLTANGTARAPGDYSTRSGSITLPPASLGATVPVPIKGDTVDEPDEDFELKFTGQSLGDAVLFDRASTITILDDDYCRRSPGYWKTHRSSWAVDHLLLGATEYDDHAMMDFLDYGGSDGSKRLGRHLVATKLNLAKGSHPWIQSTVTAADLFLIAHPPGSAPSGAALTQANSLKDQLDSYNNSGCQVP